MFHADDIEIISHPPRTDDARLFFMILTYTIGFSYF
jgi:hypothetical protein